MDSFTDFWSAVGEAFTSMKSFLTAATSYWFVFIPIVFAGARKVAGLGKSLLFYRKGKGH